jgi:hypothetical protein
MVGIRGRVNDGENGMVKSGKKWEGQGWENGEGWAKGNG